MLKNLRRNLIIVLILGLVLYLGLAVYASFGDLVAAFGKFRWYYLPLALGLVFLNYLIRFLKWEYLLRAIHLRVPPGPSFTIFISGLTMTISPAKMGEVLKSFMLREYQSVPVSRSSPIVVAERASDVIAVIILGSAGALAYGSGRSILAITMVLMVLFIGLIQWRSMSLKLLHLAERLPLARRFAGHMEEFYEKSYSLLGVRHLIPAVSLSVVGWFLECVAAWLCLKGLGLDLSLMLVTFIFVIASLAGALAMIPGGLGVAEASMAGLFIVNGLGRGDAVAATLLIRLATFWFAIGLGIIAVSIYGVRYSSGEGASGGFERDEGAA